MNQQADSMVDEPKAAPDDARQTAARGDAAAGGGDVSFTIVTCRNDVHYAKAAVASVRRFYPEHEVHVICDDDTPQRDLRQLAGVPGVRVHPVEEVTRRTKLRLRGLLTTMLVAPMPEIQRTVYLDADAVLIGPVLGAIDLDKPFIPFVTSWKDLTDESQRRWFDEWAFDTTKVRRIDPDFPALRRACWVGGSNFYVDTDRFPMDDFYRLLPHLNEQRADRDIFREDQGFWSYIANRRFVGQHWFEPFPCVLECNERGAQQCAMTLADVEAGATGGRYFLHYVGGARRYWPADHYFGDVLAHFHREFYRRYAPGAYYGDELRRAGRFGARAARYGVNRLTGRR